MSLGIMPEFENEDHRDINVHVPRITGRSVEEATVLLEEQGYLFRVVGEGTTVTAQLPARNAFVASGTRVIVYTDTEVPRDLVIVPNLSGMSYTQARNSLESQGLFIRTGGAPKTDANALVSVQSIQADREVMYGSIVEVTLINATIVEQRMN
jgi:stage V sporulation protein D (sporulation-specific penicillin-binding protein)